MFTKRKRIVFVISLLLLFGLGTYLFNLFSFDRRPINPGELVVVDTGSMEKMDNLEEKKEVAWKIEVVSKDLFVPWSIAFTSKDRLLVTERDGKIRVLENGNLKSDPLVTFPEVSTKSEEGLMGMALDPNYASNKNLYVCLAYADGNKLVDKVVKLVDRGEEIEVEKTIFDGIPAAQYHAGCRLKFGPDAKLYVTTGDASQKNLAQDRDSLVGKILRINTDGSIPLDNPYGSAIWSYGHRNPQGIAWHKSGVMWETEHGPSVFDGPAGGDEVNVIKKGENYGWPLVSHEEKLEGTEAPKITFTPAFPPGSALFYTGDIFPQFKNNLFVGGLKSEAILRVIVSEDGENVVAYETLPGLEYGRIREMVEGPDGYIYFTTSNKDGRGKLREGDDKIFRFVPQE